MTTLEFYRLAKRQKHIQPFAVTVQSACETGHWTSDLWKRGNNGAGLKVSSEWLKAGKPYITKSSVESRNGVYEKRLPSLENTIRLGSSSGTIQKDPTGLSKMRQESRQYLGLFRGLYAGRIGKWATDHKYYEKLTVKAIKLAPEIYGSKWKHKLIKDFKVASKEKVT